jgi:hypothetical protein
MDVKTAFLNGTLAQPDTSYYQKAYQPNPHLEKFFIFKKDCMDFNHLTGTGT